MEYEIPFGNIENGKLQQILWSTLLSRENLIIIYKGKQFYVNKIN